MPGRKSIRAEWAGNSGVPVTQSTWSRRRTVNIGCSLPWPLTLFAPGEGLRPEERQSRSLTEHRNQGRGCRHMAGRVNREIPWGYELRD